MSKIFLELYEALRSRACKHRKSIAAEVLSLLEENVPTADELKSRARFFREMEKLRARRPEAPGPFPSSEEMQSEDRER